MKVSDLKLEELLIRVPGRNASLTVCEQSGKTLENVSEIHIDIVAGEVPLLRLLFLEFLENGGLIKCERVFWIGGEIKLALLGNAT